MQHRVGSLGKASGMASLAFAGCPLNHRDRHFGCATIEQPWQPIRSFPSGSKQMLHAPSLGFGFGERSCGTHAHGSQNGWRRIGKALSALRMAGSMAYEPLSLSLVKSQCRRPHSALTPTALPKQQASVRATATSSARSLASSQLGAARFPSALPVLQRAGQAHRWRDTASLA